MSDDEGFFAGTLGGPVLPGPGGRPAGSARGDAGAPDPVWAAPRPAAPFGARAGALPAAGPAWSGPLGRTGAPPPAEPVSWRRGLGWATAPVTVRAVAVLMYVEAGLLALGALLLFVLGAHLGGPIGAIGALGALVLVALGAVPFFAARGLLRASRGWWYLTLVWLGFLTLVALRAGAAGLIDSAFDAALFALLVVPPSRTYFRG